LKLKVKRESGMQKFAPSHFKLQRGSGSRHYGYDNKSLIICEEEDIRVRRDARVWLRKRIQLSAAQ